MVDQAVASFVNKAKIEKRGQFGTLAKKKALGPGLELSRCRFMYLHDVFHYTKTRMYNLSFY